MGDIEEIVAQNKLLKKKINYKFRKDLKESITTFIKWRKKIK
jgi:UDP-glucose 4-epimerase